MLGKVQRRVTRAFIAKPGETRTTAELVSWCFPRLTGKPLSRHYFSVRRAAASVADRVGRTYPGGFIWRAKQSHALPKLRENPAISENIESNQ